MPESISIPPGLTFAIDAVQQPRSRFQIQHFVLGAHDTVEMAYHQLCMELKSMIANVDLREMEMKKQRIKIERLRATGDEIDAIDADMAEYSIADSEAVYQGTLRELQILIDLWHEFPHKFTRQEIEDAQPAYWRLRLARQADMQAIGEGKINYGQVDAMRQAGMLEEWMRNRDQAQALHAATHELPKAE
jgi:hypothetical protein